MDFRDQNTGGLKEPGVVSGSGFARGTVFMSYDGSSAQFSATSPVTDPNACQNGAGVLDGTLQLRDGTTYATTGGYVTRITDRNGNTLSTSADGNTITDSYGRTTSITSTCGTSPCADQIHYPGANGSARIITVNFDSLHNLLRADQTLQTTAQLWGVPACYPSGAGCSPSTTSYDPPNLVSHVDYPNGSSYRLYYTSYGDVARVDLPTGGRYEYDYANSVGTTANQPFSYTLQRFLIQKRVYSDTATSTPEQTITLRSSSRCPSTRIFAMANVYRGKRQRSNLSPRICPTCGSRS